MSIDTTSSNGVRGNFTIETLKKRSDFVRLRRGKRFHCDCFTLQCLKTPEPARITSCRVGYTVTKKVGNAVVRNRIKRRLRSAVRDTFPTRALAAFDYCFIAREPAFSVDFQTLVRQINVALDHVHANRAKGQTKTNTDDPTDHTNISNKPE